MELRELVAAVPEERVRTFLLDVLEENEHYATLFRNTFGPIDPTAMLEALDSEIRQAARLRSDRHGFIHYRNASAFGWDWSQALDTAVEPLLERGELDAVTAAVLQAMRSVWSVQMDDSDGIVFNMLYDMHHRFKQVLERADEGTQTRFVSAVCDFLCNPPDGKIEREMFSYQADKAEDILFEHFGSDARQADQLERVCRMRLEDAERRSDEIRASDSKFMQQDLTVSERSVGRWAMRLLNVLKLKGATIQELIAFAGPHVTNEEVCLMLQAEAKAAGNPQLARQLLEDAKEQLLLTFDTYPLRISEQLAELLREDDVEAYRRELLFQMNYEQPRPAGHRVPALWPLLRETYSADEWESARDDWGRLLTSTWGRLESLESDGRYDELMDLAERSGIDALRYFEKTLIARYPERVLKCYCSATNVPSATKDKLWQQVKDACPDDEWPRLALEFVSLMPDANDRMKRLHEEQLFDDLMDEVEKAGIQALPQWQQVLVQRYPNRVLKMLEDDLLHGNHLRYGNRKAYVDFCDHVRALRAIPGSDETIERIVYETLRRYPNRKALHEELRRAGL